MRRSLPQICLTTSRATVGSFPTAGAGATAPDRQRQLPEGVPRYMQHCRLTSQSCPKSQSPLALSTAARMVADPGASSSTDQPSPSQTQVFALYKAVAARSIGVAYRRSATVKPLPPTLAVLQLAGSHQLFVLSLVS